MWATWRSPPSRRTATSCSSRRTPSTRSNAPPSQQGFGLRVWNASSGKISSAKARSPMTHYQRKQRRRAKRGNHTGRNTVLIGLGVLLAVIGIGAASVLGYVISVAATTPNLDELKPIDNGQTS